MTNDGEILCRVVSRSCSMYGRPCRILSCVKFGLIQRSTHTAGPQKIPMVTESVSWADVCFKFLPWLAVYLGTVISQMSSKRFA